MLSSDAANNAHARSHAEHLRWCPTPHSSMRHIRLHMMASEGAHVEGGVAEDAGKQTQPTLGS